ncbi:MAG: SRPBCC family protein [Nitrosopumilus sp.]|nr:SRPBCC family protein [Nitrosopumilus sp.]
MIISHSLEINDSREKLWNTLKSFDGVERYFQIVSKSKVEGTGQGAKRTCDVNMGSQTFQIQETLEELDDTNHSITVFLDNGPIQMKGMRFTFVVRDMGNERSEITISTNVENPDAAGMAKCIFAMMCQGLKDFHEL